MKAVIWIIAILFVPASAYLQEESTSLDKEVVKYLTALEQRDLKKLTSYLYPATDNNSEKNKTADLLNRIFCDSSHQIQYANSQLVSSTAIFQYENIKYSTVFFTTELSIYLGKNNCPELILEILEKQYGEKNILYNNCTNTATIHVIDFMYAIMNPKWNSWKFHSREDMVPQKVIDKFALGIVNWMSGRI